MNDIFYYIFYFLYFRETLYLVLILVPGKSCSHTCTVRRVVHILVRYENSGDSSVVVVHPRIHS